MDEEGEWEWLGTSHRQGNRDVLALDWSKSNTWTFGSPQRCSLRRWKDNGITGSRDKSDLKEPQENPSPDSYSQQDQVWSLTWFLRGWAKNLHWRKGIKISTLNFLHNTMWVLTVFLPSVLSGSLNTMGNKRLQCREGDDNQRRHTG